MILSFSWILQLSQEKEKNNVHAFFGGVGGGAWMEFETNMSYRGGGVNGGMQICHDLLTKSAAKFFPESEIRAQIF